MAVPMTCLWAPPPRDPSNSSRRPPYSVQTGRYSAARRLHWVTSILLMSKGAMSSIGILLQLWTRRGERLRSGRSHHDRPLGAIAWQPTGQGLRTALRATQLP